MTKKITTTIRIEVDLKKRLDDLVDGSGHSAIINMLLRKYLDQIMPASTTQ